MDPKHTTAHDKAAEAKAEAKADAAEAKAKAAAPAVPVVSDPTRWVINLAALKPIKMPPLGSPVTTLVIRNCVEDAMKDDGYDTFDPVRDKDKKAAWDKRLAASKKAKSAKAAELKKDHKPGAKPDADAGPAVFKFLVRHSPCPCGQVEVEDCATADEAKAVILSVLPACSIEQITEVPKAAV